MCVLSHGVLAPRGGFLEPLPKLETSRTYWLTQKDSPLSKLQKNTQQINFYGERQIGMSYTAPKVAYLKHSLQGKTRENDIVGFNNWLKSALEGKAVDRYLQICWNCCFS